MLNAEIEHIAYRFRIDNELFDLPLTYDDILRVIDRNRYQLRSYEESQDEIKELGLVLNMCTSDAFIADVGNGDIRIFMDDTKTAEEKKKALLHELSHLACGHVHAGCALNHSGSDQFEREAERCRVCVEGPPRAVKERGGKSVKRIKEITLLNDDDSELVAQMVKELPYRPACDDEKQLISLMRSTRAYKRYRLNALTRLFCGLLTAMIAIAIPVMGMAVVAQKIVAPPLADPYTTTCDPMRTMDDQLRDFQEISDSVYITKDNYLFHLIGCPDLRGTEKMRVDIGEAIDGDYFPCPDCVLQSEQYEWLNK